MSKMKNYMMDIEEKVFDIVDSIIASMFVNFL